jgi:hypothetical protein
MGCNRLVLRREKPEPPKTGSTLVEHKVSASSPKADICALSRPGIPWRACRDDLHRRCGHWDSLPGFASHILAASSPRTQNSSLAVVPCCKLIDPEGAAHEAARVHHASRRRGGRVAASGADAAGGDAGDRLLAHQIASLPTVEDCANGYRTAALTPAQGNELGVDDVPAPSQGRPANPAGPADPG